MNQAMSRRPDRQLLLKSFGYGIYQAQLVPPEFEGETVPSNGDKMRATAALEARVRKSGLEEVLEVVSDPEDPRLAFVLVRRGLPPCKLERQQWEDRDLERLETAAEASMSSRLAERVSMLRG